jgi:serine/threonine-protein kinase
VTWTTTLTVDVAAQQILQIPALETEPAARTNPPAQPASARALPSVRVASPPKVPPHGASPEEKTPKDSLPVAGLIAGGAGVVALGVGVGFGFSSLASYAEADELCPSPHLDCSDGAISKRTSAERAAWISNIAFGVGLVGVGAGAYLILTSGPDAHREGKVVLRATPVREGAWFGVLSSF